MKKIIILLVFLIVVLSCKNKVVSDSIIISVPDTLSSIPVYQLDGKVVENKSIKVQTYSDHSMAMLEFINGSTDMILTGFTQGVANRKENPEIVILSTIVWGISSIMVRDQNIESIFNRENTKIALPFQGSPLDIQFKSIISARGIENKFELLYFPFQQAIGLMNNGSLDAVIVPEPIASKLEESGNAKRLTTMFDIWSEINNGDGRSPQISLFTTNKFISKNKKATKDILNLLKESTAIVNNVDSTVIEKYSNQFSMSQDIFRKALHQTVYQVNTPEEDKLISQKYLLMTQYKNIPDDAFYYNAQ